MKPQSGRHARLLKAPSIPAGPASSSKVSYLQKTTLAFVPSASCVSRCEAGNEIGFPTPASWDGLGCWALLSPGQRLSDSRAAGGWGTMSLRETSLMVPVKRELSPPPCFSDICTFRDLTLTHTEGVSRSLCTHKVQVWGYVSVETVTFPHKKHGAEGENAGQKDVFRLSVWV